MRAGGWMSAVVLVTVACSSAPVRQPVVPNPPPTDAIVFEGATVIPMDTDEVLTDHSVLVENGRIALVAPTAAMSLPDTIRRIDARGKFIIPGLAEMHAHLPGPQAPPEAMSQTLTLFVANGVTVARGMLGAPNQLTVREEIAQGKRLGPTLLLGAPSIHGNSAPDPDTAEALVRAHKAAGYDFLKLHPGLKPEVFDRMVKAANEVGLTFAGHVSAEVGLERALEARQSTVDHLDGYLESSGDEALRARVRSPTDQVSFEELVNGARPERQRELAQKTKEAGTWNVPTLALFERFFSLAPTPTEAEFPEGKYVSRAARQQWALQDAQRSATHRQENVGEATLKEAVRLRRAQLKALADAGAGVLMGSDAPQSYSVPGFSLARETKAMVASGMTPRQVLESGTVNVARYAREALGVRELFGAVRPSHRADLVVLDQNPLEDIGAITRISGVMVRGSWLPRSELDALLAEVSQAHAEN